MNEDHVTKDLSSDSFSSQTQTFVFGSSADASLTPLRMPESIVEMSMTSYSSILSEVGARRTNAVDDSAIILQASAWAASGRA